MGFFDPNKSRDPYNNRPDIVMIDKSTQKVALVDIAVPNDSNIADKRVEKIRKYTDLAVT